MIKDSIFTKKVFNKHKVWLFVLPSLVGMCVFYFVPSARSLLYAFTNVNGEFVWFDNFIDVLTNSVFRLAAKNSLMFIAVSVPFNVMIAFFLASLLRNLRYKKVLALAFMLPLVIPSGAVVFFWNSLFADNGVINGILFRAGMNTVPWFMTDWSFWIVILIFLVRSIGFNMVLFMAGFSRIPKEYYEYVQMDGAGVFTTFRHVTAIYLLPTTFLVFMMSIINSFRVFREIYLLYGQYPHQGIYMLQHYINNQFLFVNMQRLSVTATVLSVFVAILVWGVFFGQKKISETF
jgi:multiple sugar transport system permease protein